MIPLSPDPFGRYSSAQDPSRSRSGTFKSISIPPPVPKLPQAASVQPSEPTSNTSRFSTDSTQGLDVSSKRTTVVSVKSIKNLWRRSNKSNSVSMPAPPPQTSPPATSAHFSAQQTQAPLGERTSISQLSPPLPTPRERSMSTSSTTTGASFSSAPPPIRPARPSQEEMEIPDILDHTEQHHVVAPFAARSHAPIVVSHMLPSGREPFDRLHFDQESPYPIRRAPPPRYPSRPPSPAQSPPISVQQLPPANMPPPQPIQSFSQMEVPVQKSARKSILKWKSSSSTSSSSSKTEPQTLKSRRPSLISFGSSNKTAESLADIPPSPHIPDQFLAGAQPEQWPSRRGAHLTTPSTDSSMTFSGGRKSSLTANSVRSASPAYSLTSSQSRPSIDSSHFEMVSPRMPTLAYPHTTIDS